MQSLENGLPDARLKMGPAVFGIWATGRGVRNISFPAIETVLAGRRKVTVNVNINRDLGHEESRWVSETAALLETVLHGRPPEVCPRIDLGGTTMFTRRVLEIAMEIPWGETKSYRWIARKMGKPNATRAVGQALGRNPVPMIISCHRVIKEDGSLGGFGLGTEWKRWLLELEREGKGL